MTATRQAFSVSVAPDGAFVLTGELDLSTAGSSETWSTRSWLRAEPSCSTWRSSRSWMAA
jgi:hypothetical protein